MYVYPLWIYTQSNDDKTSKDSCLREFVVRSIVCDTTTMRIINTRVTTLLRRRVLMICKRSLVGKFCRHWCCGDSAGLAGSEAFRPSVVEFVAVSTVVEPRTAEHAATTFTGVPHAALGAHGTGWCCDYGCRRGSWWWHVSIGKTHGRYWNYFNFAFVFYWVLFHFPPQWNN